MSGRALDNANPTVLSTTTTSTSTTPSSRNANSQKAKLRALWDGFEGVDGSGSGSGSDEYDEYGGRDELIAGEEMEREDIDAQEVFGEFFRFLMLSKYSFATIALLLGSSYHTPSYYFNHP